MGLCAGTPSLLLPLLLLSLLLLSHPLSTRAQDGVMDGVMDSSFSAGAAAFEGGVTSEEASASDKAVPEPADPSVPPPADYYEKLVAWFMEWLRANRVDTSAVEIVILPQDSSDPWRRPHMKLRAARDLKKDEEIFRLPLSVQVSSQSVLFHDQPYRDPGYVHESNWAGYSAIASWILRERAAEAKSPWAAYVRMMPPRVPLPLFYPDSLLQELQFEQVIGLVHSYRHAIEEEYAACRPDAVAQASREVFFWAMALGMSRAFAGTGRPELNIGQEGEDESTTVMLPLADMMDHDNNYNAESVLDSEGTFIWRVNRDLAKGDELLNQYGLKNTDILLTSYGFFLDPNEFDSVQAVHRQNGSRDLYQAYYVTEDHAPFTDIDDQWALYVSGLADTASEKDCAEERPKHSGLLGPKYDLGHADSLHVWEGGVIDPPLLATLAATVYFMSFKKEPDYDRLARMSTWYGWHLYDASCADLARDVPLTEEETQSFISAAAGVKTLVESMLRQLPTTLQEDEDILDAIEMCKAGGAAVESNPDMKAYCAGLTTDGVSLEDRELVVRARLLKKRVLHVVSARITQTCSPAKAGEQGASSPAQAGEQGASSPSAASTASFPSPDELQAGEEEDAEAADWQGDESPGGEAAPGSGSASGPGPGTEESSQSYQASQAFGEKLVQGGDRARGEPEIRISTSMQDDKEDNQGKGKEKKSSRGWWGS